MSPDPVRATDRAGKRRDRAERDIRQTHGIALGLVDAWGGEPWGGTRGTGWSPAETCLHLALAAENTLDALRVVAAAGPPERPRAQTLLQRLTTKSTLWTWRVPGGVTPLPGTDPAGLILQPENMKNRHTSWAAAFVGFLRDHQAGFLERVRCMHPYFGELDTYEWVRLLLVHARRLELQLGRPAGGRGSPRRPADPGGIGQ